MSTSKHTATPRLGQRGVLGVMILFLLGIFVISFVYRLDHPSLVQRVGMPDSAHGDAAGEGQTPAGMPGQMPGQGQMDPAVSARLAELMKKMGENPDDPATLLEIAHSFMQAGVYDKAEMFLNRAAVADPSNPEVLGLLGLALFHQEKFPQAAGYYEQVVALEPHNGEALYNLGILYKHYLEQPDKAQKNFEAILALPGLDKELEAMAKQELGSSSQ